MSSNDVSVVISPPSIDLDSYQLFDEDYQRTVENILSDEPSFDGSFDDYRGDMMDGASEKSENVYDEEPVGRSSDTRKSPYFFSGQPSTGRSRAQKHITRIDIDDDDESDQAKGNGPVAAGIVDDNGAINDEVTEEDILFARVGSDERDRLLGFVVSHPFMQEGAYPVKRSARRNFMRDVHQEGVSVGMDDDSADRLAKYVKKTYLDLYGNGRIELDGPEFGDEIDDEGEEIRKSPKMSKEERKRKRASDGKSNDKLKKRKKRLSEVSDSHGSVKTPSDEGHEIIDLDPVDPTGAVSESHSPVMKAQKREMAASGTPKRISKGDSQNSNSTSIVDRPEGSHRATERAQVAKKQPNGRGSLGEKNLSQRSPSKPQSDPICLESDSDEIVEKKGQPQWDHIKKGVLAKVPTSSTPNSAHTTSSENLKLQQNGSNSTKKQRNRKKRESRKLRKAQRHRESLLALEFERSSLNGDQQKTSATNKVIHKKSNEGLTASDEVKSKYFMSSQKERMPVISAAKPNGPYPGVKHESIPEETRKILREYDLQPDFLSDSDSPLSDVPSETRKILREYDLQSDFLSDSDSPLSDVPSETRMILREYDLQSDFLSDSDSSLSDVPSDDDAHSVVDDSPSLPFSLPTLPPSTPTKGLSPSKSACVSLVRTPRLRVPKVSPYFPKPLLYQVSCLPFPSIDAPKFGLVQEHLAHDPFRLLIATIFLNRTRGSVALPVLFKVFERFPTVDEMSTADLSDLASMIHCLGFQNQRAKKCISLAQTWLAHPPTKGKRYRKLHYPCKLDGLDVGRGECTGDEDARVAWEIAHLPGVGAYSLDSWRIFCRDELRGLAKDWKGSGAESPNFVPEWKSVLPQDKELRAYLTWMWLKEGWVWDPCTGKRTRASEKMMRAARRGGVAHEEDGNWVLEMSPVKKAANGLTA